MFKYKESLFEKKGRGGRYIDYKKFLYYYTVIVFILLLTKFVLAQIKTFSGLIGIIPIAGIIVLVGATIVGFASLLFTIIGVIYNIYFWFANRDMLTKFDLMPLLSSPGAALAYKWSIVEPEK